MSVPDFIKDNVYLPYFRRHTHRVRSQQILLGVGIGALVIAGVVGWWLWNRRSKCRGAACEEVTPNGE